MDVFIKINRTQADQLKAAMIFWPIIAYTPFFFEGWVHPYLRIGCFSLLSLYLFFSYTRYSKDDASVLCLLILLATLLVLGDSSGMQGLIKSGNYCLTILFGWGLSRHLKLSRDRLPILLGLYVQFFYLISIFSLLSLIYFLTLGEFDLFGFKSDVAAHLVTPFGVLFKRPVGDFAVYRSFFYFVEGAHLALFYAVNIIVVAPLLKDKTVSFKRVNLLGGILTMSMTFYVVLFVLYGSKKISSISGAIAIFVGTILFMYLIQIFDVASFSSADDRTERFILFFILMAEANVTQLLFGHGVSFFETLGFAKTFNSGFTLSIYETGFVGLAMQMIILFRLSPYFILFIFYLLASNVLDPIHMPLFWFFIIITSQALKNESAASTALGSSKGPLLK